MPDSNNVEDKDAKMSIHPNRMEKYKDNQKGLQSEANDINHHQMKIINYTNSNRSAPNESYYDNKDFQIEEIVEHLDEVEENHKDNRNKIVEELENLEDEIIVINKDTIKEERTNKNLPEVGKGKEVKDIMNKEINIGKNFNVKPQEAMSDFDDVTKGQNVIVLKNIQPKEDFKMVRPVSKKKKKSIK